MSVPEDWRPTASWDALRRRAALLRQLREFFRSRGYLEVDTPLLSADTVVDRHLDPLAAGELGAEPRLFLQTSPEFAMKRLLAAGGEAIFQITRAVRAGERGPAHNSEFTMVEWYRAGQPPDEAMRLLGELADETLCRGPADRLTYREVFLQHAGLDPHRATADQWRRAAERLGIDANDAGDDLDAWRFLVLAAAVEPQLGRQRPLIVCDFPASQSALARLRQDDHGVAVAERFELYADGLELANGYHELLDADELLRRNRAVNAQRVADGKPPLPEQSRLLAAMRHGLPPCCGVALGFDRLLMAATGAGAIDEVLPFPRERA